MKAFISLIVIGLHLQANELSLFDSSKACLENIDNNIYTRIDEQAKVSNKKLFWIEKKNLILQEEERATIFKLKLAKGLNVVTLASKRGQEIATVCVQRQSNLIYIDSIGEKCFSKTKSNFYQSIIYPHTSYESNDLISNKIFSHLNTLRNNFKKQINRTLCEDYIQTYKSCLHNYSELNGKNTIPKTESRYQFVLSEIRKTLISQCQNA